MVRPLLSLVFLVFSDFIQPLAVRRALDDANLDMSHINGIAFTRGPGMSGCLSVCANAAKTLASALNKPLIGVHHMVSTS